MAARGYEDEYDAYDDEDAIAPREHSHEEEDDDDDEWGLFSTSSPSSSSPVAPPAPPPNLIRPPTALPSSTECSMDADSSTDGEDVGASRPKRAAPAPHSTDAEATTAHQRRVKIKELTMKYQQECLSLCRTLLPLQQQWRRELEDPVPGLRSFDHLKQAAAIKQKDFLPSNAETQVQSSAVKSGASSAATSNFRNTRGTITSTKRSSSTTLRKKLPWRANEREAIRRGILMFGVGRSEKVRAVMRGSLKNSQHGLGDIADCCFEFLRACSSYADEKESAFVESLLEKAEESGIEVGPEVSERVGQWEKMEKSGAVWLKRIKLIENLGHAVRLCCNPATQEIAYNAVDSLGDATVPCGWWTRNSDLALLAGIYKHGFGNYEALRMDDEFAKAFEPSWDGRKGFVSDQSTSRTFFDHDSDTELNARDSSGESSWPDSNVLTRRLKRLVEHLGRVG